MNNITRIGNATGALTDYEINYIENQVTKTVTPLLVGRTLMPTRALANAGFTKYTYYTEADMSAAQISMTGEEQSMDVVDLDGHEVKIPIISKDYNLHWRDVLARRNNGEDLNTANAVNAARQIAEAEDLLILSGEITGTPALGIEGMTTATGRNTVNGGDWSGTYLTEIGLAISALETDGYYGPYTAIMPSTWFAQLRVVLANYGWAFNAVNELLGGSATGTERIKISNNVYAADGAADSILVVDTSPGNFELVVGQDVSTYLSQLPTMNYQGKVWEAVVPVIKRPEAICEIDTIT